MQNVSVQIRHQCEACGGRGHAPSPHCLDCDRQYPMTDFARLAALDVLPCGHASSALLRSEPCDLCWGKGARSRWIPLQELELLLATPAHPELVNPAVGS